jgi:hypothetical protein
VRHDARVPRTAFTLPLLLVLVAACTPLKEPGTATDERPRSLSGTAAAALAGLVVSSAYHGGYRRAVFGDGWLDLDGDGCDTREEILRRDLRSAVVRAGCVVLSGVLTDPYSGDTVSFRRGPRTSDDVQIDHVVALADAWRTGAWQWDERRRERFANDPLELLAVDGEENQAKGDKDAGSWLPPRQSEQCAYVARQIAIKARWSLSVRPREKVAMRTVLDACPGERLPSS